MPRLTCLCSETIDLSRIPNPLGFKIISEAMVEAIIENLLETYRQNTSDQEFERRIFDSFHSANPTIPHAYECPNCGRLAVFSRASDAEPALWFKNESTEKGNTVSLYSLTRQK